MMMMKGLFLFATISTVSAFTVRSQSSPNKSRTTTALNLTPNQASQLVDAYNAVQHAKKDDVNDDFVAVGMRPSQEPITAVMMTTTTGGVSATARALFHRFLSPLSSHHAHDENDDDDSDAVDDVVYYPVVGFTYVPDAKDHSRALPTVSNPSCRLIYEKLLDKQVVYGEWKQPKVVVERKEKRIISRPNNNGKRSA